VFKGICKKCLAGNDTAWERRGNASSSTKGLSIETKPVKIKN
jgi:hypothetical protein